AVGILSGEREDDPLRLDDLAIDAALPVLAALRRAHAEAVGAADADVHVAVNRGEPLRAPPAGDVLRLRPRLERQPARRVDQAGYHELALSRHVSACAHVASPCAAVPADSPAAGRGSAPRTRGSVAATPTLPSAGALADGTAAIAPPARVRSVRRARAP